LERAAKLEQKWGGGGITYLQIDTFFNYYTSQVLAFVKCAYSNETAATEMMQKLARCSEVGLVRANYRISI